MQQFGSTAGLAQIFPDPDIHEYHRLAEISGMSVDSQHSGYNVSMCSSVGSNTMTTTLTGTMTGTASSIQDRTMEQNDSVTQALGEDALSNALLDNLYPSEGLRGYEKWTIDLCRLEMGPAFAQGAFGKLYRGTYNGEDVAVKILERPENNAERAQILENQYAKEVKMLANLQHKNVVRFIGACRKPMVCCIVTEYAKGGSVRRFLAAKGALSLKLAVKFALDIARGMEYLHSFGVIHRDLKSDNLLIADDRSIKIADFGVARIEVHTDMTPETGTYRWMAPEMIQRRSYNHKVDVYSFGVVLWELVSGSIPFPNMTAVQAAFAVVRGARPTIPAHCPPALSQIMVSCWDSNPDARPNFTETVRLLEDAEQVIMKTVGIAKFRWGCLAPPLTLN